MNIKIIESPRDAMQGIKRWIPTKNKIKYVNQLLRVGFHTIDIGSFVSEKAIPQMKDTDLVLESLDVHSSSSQLSVIVANERGIDSALAYDSVNYLGFPFSISKIFQLKNTNTHGNIREKFYCLPNGGENASHIRVTGSHMIFYKEKVIPVSEHPAAIALDDSFSSPILYCLKTSTQRIPIGKYLFWDWDDDEVAKK